MVQQLPVNSELLGQGGDVADYHFGAARIALRRLSGGLKDIQAGSCFYCSRRIGGLGHVDHFVPWVRYPRDLGHNFVLTHDMCNSRKADLLAGVPHLDRRLERNATRRAELDQIFSEARMLHDADTSKHVAAWSYNQVEQAGGLVWLGGERFEHLGREWRSRFAMVT